MSDTIWTYEGDVYIDNDKYEPWISLDGHNKDLTSALLKHFGPHDPFGHHRDEVHGGRFRVTFERLGDA